MPAELPSTEQISTETSRLVALNHRSYQVLQNSSLIHVSSSVIKWAFMVRLKRVLNCVIYTRASSHRTV